MPRYDVHEPTREIKKSKGQVLLIATAICG